MKLLLVDDDRPLLASVSRCLRTERPGWEVATASEGAEAMRILRSEPADLLITDIQMPGLNGMALLAEIRRDPALASLPLIFITAATDRKTMRQGMASGADDYLVKPFTTEELVLAIEGRLRRLEAGAEAAESSRALHQTLARALTGREFQVLARIGRGLVTKEIAAELDLSPMTVSVHRANIMRKLDLHNAAALAALAIRANLA
jgi:DNA-binding NarL/FixJ family response regulator